MCGITGKIFTRDGVVSGDAIEKMNEAIKHRGPDDGGVYISARKNVGLGHRRLSIIDLSPLGQQPMSYLGRYQIVFNGEIYNFQEERKKLVSDGYEFKSKTDTEVILALYDKYKEGCLEHLRGMFSFAIYDEQEEVVFCARDRVGKKPFKYYWDGKLFMFASELKAILTQSEYKREPDYVAIHHFLSLQYVPAPLTGFKGIFKLPAATFIKLDIKSGNLIQKKYWDLDFTKKVFLSETEWKRHILEKLDEATRIRMIADVPLGVFLSGGVDSSAVVAMMARHSKIPVKTFSIGFVEQKFNELPYARMVAEKFKTDHTEFVVKPEALDVLPLLVKHYEEPYADSSALPTYYLSKLTHQHVTVALNGDGGDENFAGYPWYSIQKFAVQYQKFLPIHNAIVEPLSRIVSSFYASKLTDRAWRFAQTLKQSDAFRYLHYICYFTNRQKAELYGGTMRHYLDNMDSCEVLAKYFERANKLVAVDQAQFVDINTYLVDDLLVKVDIATMSVGLEGRSPFLDQEFMEMAAQIPDNLKLRGFNTKKYILKKALAGILPDEVMYRRKQGFSVPIESWFRADLKQYLRSIILSEKAMARGMFKKEVIEKLLAVHNDSTINHAPRLWALLTLELWFREYFD